MKALLVYGTRPEAIKLAPVAQALGVDARNTIVTVATGQHRHLASQAATALGLATDRDLDLMLPNQTPTQVISAVLGALPQVFSEEHPDVVIVQGDTTTAAATALATFHVHLPVAHVEAGLRTGDMEQPFPEEMNRRLIATVAQLHLAPTEAARSNLLREGIAEEDIVVTGNTVVDSWHDTARRARPPAGFTANPDCDLIFLTAHRRENLGAPLKRIAEAARTIADRGNVQLVIAGHLNPQAKAAFDGLSGHNAVDLLPPLAPEEVAWLLTRSRLLLTDSGGLQEEASTVGTPVLVLREVTERPEVLDAGLGLLVGSDTHRIVTEATRILDRPEVHEKMAGARQLYGDGHAAERIAKAIVDRFGGR